MPQIFKVGSYIIYFWANENDPLEISSCSCGERCSIGSCDKNLDYEKRKMLTVQ